MVAGILVALPGCGSGGSSTTSSTTSSTSSAPPTAAALSQALLQNKFVDNQSDADCAAKQEIKKLSPTDLQSVMNNPADKVDTKLANEIGAVALTCSLNGG
jgi:hypothetical protein